MFELPTWPSVSCWLSALLNVLEWPCNWQRSDGQMRQRELLGGLLCTTDHWPMSRLSARKKQSRRLTQLPSVPRQHVHCSGWAAVVSAVRCRILLVNHACPSILSQSTCLQSWWKCLGFAEILVVSSQRCLSRGVLLWRKVRGPWTRLCTDALRCQPRAINDQRSLWRVQH